MRLFRWALVGCLIAGLAQTSFHGDAARAAEASNKEKIVGVWETGKGGARVPKDSKIEFTKDGKVKAASKIEGRTITLEATYSIEGDKLKFVIKGPDGKKVEDTVTIQKLTDTEMIYKDSKGGVAEFKKAKK